MKEEEMKKLLIVFVCLMLTGCAAATCNVKNDFILDSTSGNSLVVGKMSIIDFWYYNNGYRLLPIIGIEI
jgi:starvation-inducible outer membrane lipoprotein